MHSLKTVMIVSICLMCIGLIPFIFGCDNMYPEEKMMVYEVEKSKAPTVIYPCDFKIKEPYNLIQWNDGTYGILFKKELDDWYKIKDGRAIEFTYIIQDATHFKDSCSAKQDLQRYLDSRITYKIVK